MKVTLLKHQLLFCLLIAALISNAQNNKLNLTGRDVQNLDGKWNVIIDWYDSGNASAISTDKKPAGANDFVEFSFDNSQTLNVPGDWNSQRSELKYYEGTVWYKRDFTYTKKAGKHVFLHFGAVSYRSEVYLNGHKVGAHEGGFTSFDLEVTGQIKNGTNLLVVKVNNERRVDAIPARKFDWWNYGGITRSVIIAETPDEYIADYFVQLKKGSKDHIEGWVQFSEPKKQHVTLSIPEAGINRVFDTDDKGRAFIDLTVKLMLWSPQRPKLYPVKITCGTDTAEDRIGFRSIEVKGTEIMLNGQPVFLRGISFHEEVPQRQGRASSPTDSRMLLTWAKELGCNFIRLAHYPQSEETVRLAEEMGFMLWEEIPVWQGIQFSDPKILGKANAMLQEMISRDKNRCGVIIWSLSNETAPSPERNATLKQMAADARRADPTRLISSAYDHFKTTGNEILIDDPLSEYLDVLAVNKYMGWYQSWPAEPGNVLWKSNYNKPLIFSEFGSEAMYGQHGSKDTASLWTEEHQEQLYRYNIEMFRKIPFLRGTCPWILADFRTPFRMHAQYQEGWNRKGLLSDKGFKKKAWYVMRSFYQEKQEQELRKK
ncbi:glycoside hydrolase family 2 [Mucilaginibacter daejeonensis]|uniref:glycoside hydrolase family 2 protein n=1 Tax=Mucilaginibacter daejeonensis TaxID=398049 RepID=UPI001D1730B2|nr:glycoside hydrolase family 2 TIM barrel-domain containing protein [Mucilaginibacter daejeonensis]UEG51674.1 glycoside hydrolase family 2 [Mucilaginibacter daejeonensis]